MADKLSEILDNIDALVKAAREYCDSSESTEGAAETLADPEPGKKNEEFDDSGM